MIIRVNGTDVAIADGTTIASMITDWAGSTRGSAVVVDGEVVPRSSWEQRTLTEGSDVELITAVQGG